MICIHTYIERLRGGEEEMGRGGDGERVDEERGRGGEEGERFGQRERERKQLL